MSQSWVQLDFNIISQFSLPSDTEEMLNSFFQGQIVPFPQSVSLVSWGNYPVVQVLQLSDFQQLRKAHVETSGHL